MIALENPEFADHLSDPPHSFFFGVNDVENWSGRLSAGHSLAPVSHPTSPTSSLYPAACVVAIVLLVAAGGKAVEVAEGGTHDAVSVVVGLEILLALWLLTTVKTRAAVFSAAGLFIVFSAYSLTRIHDGDCGCFGSWHKGMPLVMATGDLIIAGCLLTLLAFPRRLTATIATAALATAAATLVLHPLLIPRADNLDRWSERARRLPVQKTDLETGQLVFVFFYDPDCASCQHGLPRVQEFARANARQSKVVLVNVGGPPSSLAENNGWEAVDYAEARNWLRRTPTSLLLADGETLAVAEGEEASDFESLLARVLARRSSSATHR